MDVPFLSTVVWKVNPNQPDESMIASAASVVLGGGVIVYPTETLYGLGGHPMLKATIDRIYSIKGRLLDKPLPLIATDMKSILAWMDEWPHMAQQLAEVFWPGPLTLVLPARRILASRLHESRGKIAIRISSHPVCKALSAAAGGLLVSTSANFSDQPASNDPLQISPELMSKVDGILDAGTLSGKLPSTIVDVSTFPPQLLRRGCIPWERITNVLGL